MELTDIKNIKKFATNNKDQIKSSNWAGCYHCLELFHANEVSNFLLVENTALCPKCNIDSVIGDKSGYILNSETLKELHNYWFKG